jgi:hypothetical protein
LHAISSSSSSAINCSGCVGTRRKSHRRRPAACVMLGGGDVATNWKRLLHAAPGLRRAAGPILANANCIRPRHEILTNRTLPTAAARRACDRVGPGCSRPDRLDSVAGCPLGDQHMRKAPKADAHLARASLPCSMLRGRARPRFADSPIAAASRRPSARTFRDIRPTARP